MGKEEVYSVLEKNKKPMSRTDIAKEANLSLCLASHIISRLVRGKEIKIIEIDREQAMKLYRCKRRMRLYFVD